MTSRVTVSLPVDVAAGLADLPTGEVSGYVAEAIKRRQVADAARHVMRAAGHREFPYDPAGAERRLAERQVSDDTRRQAVVRLAGLTGQDPDDLEQQLNRSSAGMRR